jgi:hypothetical protein
MSLLEILAQFPVSPLSPFLSPTSRPREHRPDSRVQTDLIIGPPGRFLVIFIFILHHRTRPGTFGPLTAKARRPCICNWLVCDHSRHAVPVIPHTDRGAAARPSNSEPLFAVIETHQFSDDNKDKVAKMVCKLDLFVLPRSWDNWSLETPCQALIGRHGSSNTSSADAQPLSTSLPSLCSADDYMSSMLADHTDL